MEADEQARRTAVPAVVWLLLLLGLARMIAESGADGLVLYDRTLTWGTAIGVLGSPADFLLAAAIVTGGLRWSAGRVWLSAAALGFALSGILDLAYWAWIWANSDGPGGLGSIDPATVDLLNVRSWVASGLAVAATILAAAGLSAARARGGAVRQRPLTALGIGLIGLLSAASWVAFLANVPQSDLQTPLASGLGALWMVAWAAVAIASLSARRTVDAVPETIIAVGATAIPAATGFQNWNAIQSPTDYLSNNWTWAGYYLPYAVTTLARLAVATGLALGSPRLREALARGLGGEEP